MALALRRRSHDITASKIAKVCVAWRKMQTRWDELPIGESIHIKWPSIHSPRKRG
jgi:hypothetical protein